MERVAHALEQQVENRDFGWCDVEIGHAQGNGVESIPRRAVINQVCLSPVNVGWAGSPPKR